MVGLGRIARRRADAPIGLAEQFLGGQALLRRIAPEFLPDPLMHGLGEGFGETVGQGLHQDGGIIVIGAGETLGDRLLLEAGGDHEGADVIRLAALDRRHEIRQRHPAAARRAWRAAGAR